MTLRFGSNRRSFLAALAAGAGAAQLRAASLFGRRERGDGYNAFPDKGNRADIKVSGFGSSGDPYAELGVVPLINAAGTLTVIGGSLMPPEVDTLMRMGGEHFCAIDDLERAAGKRIAAMLKLPAGYTGLVTAGAAAALVVGYAGILTGDNRQWIQQIPDLSGMPKSEVIIQKSHRYPFDHQIRQTGVKLVEVETREELLAAIGPRTAALHFTNLFNPLGQIKVDEWVKIAHAHNLPAYNDAAADTPPISRLWEYVNLGYDLVTFSGGKDIRGPQCAGLLLGREDLIACALKNMSPQEDTIGRPCKVGKEEIFGMVKALELFVGSDQEALLKRYYAQLGVIADAVGKIPGVTTEYKYDPNRIDNHTVDMAVRWDPAKVNLTTRQVLEQLAATRPVAIRAGGDDEGNSSRPPRIGLSAWQLKPGEERVIARRLAEILSAGAVSA